MSSRSSSGGRGGENNNNSEASPTRLGGSPRLSPAGSDAGSNSGNNLMPTLSCWETENVGSGDDNDRGHPSHGHAETAGGEISTLSACSAQGRGTSSGSPRETPSFLASGGHVGGKDSDGCLQDTGCEGLTGEERVETDEQHWRGLQHPSHQRRGRSRFAGDSNGQGGDDGRDGVNDDDNNGFLSRSGMASYITQQDNDQSQQPLKKGAMAAQEHMDDASDNGRDAPRGDDGKNLNHHKSFHTIADAQRQAPSLGDGFDLGGRNRHGDVASGNRTVGDDRTAPSSMHYEHARERPSADSFSENDTDRGGDSCSLRDSRVSEAETSHRGSDVDDEEEEDGDGTEGQTQKRGRRERREYYQRLIGDGFRTIASCYVTTNRAIRGVEANQRHMLDAENEIGEDLLKFGVHVREATQLMQAQITAAFTGEEAIVPSVAPGSRARRAVDSSNPQQPNEAAECGKSGPTKAAVLGRNNDYADSTATATTTGGTSSRRSTLRANGGPPGLMSHPLAASAMATTNTPPEAIDQSRHFEASGRADDLQAFAMSSTHHSKSYSVGDADGGADVPGEQQQQQQQQQDTFAGRTAHSGGQSVAEENYGGRVAPSLSEESRGGVTSGGNVGGGMSAVKRPRWNSSFSGGDGGTGGLLPSSLFRRQQQSAPCAVAFQNHVKANGGWSREC